MAFETIPSIKEAESLVQLLREFPNSKAWISFSCKVTVIMNRIISVDPLVYQSNSLFVQKHCQDGKCISDGSPFTDAVQIANRSKQLVAVGVNCCPPALVEPLLDSARSLLSPDMCWVVYPNSGEEWDTERG